MMAASIDAVPPIELVGAFATLSSDAVLAVDSTGAVVFFNREAERIFGYSPDEVVGGPLAALLPERFSSDHDEHVRRYAGGALVACAMGGAGSELSGRRCGGEEFPADVTLTKVGHGEDLLMVATIRDVTERVEAARVLEERTRQLHNLFDTSLVALWEEDFSTVADWLGRLRKAGVTDLRRHLESNPEDVDRAVEMVRVRDVNAAAARLLGVGSPGDLIGDLPPSRFAGTERMTVIEELVAIWCGEVQVSSEFEIDTPEGARDVAMQWSVPVGDEGPDWAHVVAAMMDMTARHATEDALRLAEAELIRAHKLEAIGQLAAGVAHEINTPIQFAADNARFLEGAFFEAMELADDPEDEASRLELDELKEEVEESFGDLMEGMDRVATIVRAMKSFSHPGATGYEDVDFNELVQTTVTVSTNEWKYVADCVVDLDPGLPSVPCKSQVVSQVVLNLITNAADAISDAPQEKGVIRVTTSAAGPWAVLTVEDDGTGIPESIRDRVFELFFTTKDVGRGSGQGLAMAHRAIVDQHGGEIDFDSRPGEGTTFTIRLPFELVVPDTLLAS